MKNTNIIFDSGEDVLRKLERDSLKEKIRALEERMNKTQADQEKLKQLKEQLKKKENTKESAQV